MAVDDVLLAAAADGQAAIRFYGWAAPTLSLGYFQPYARRAEHAASASCAIVRRASGGAAILHDRELTYAIALPVAIAAGRNARELYTAAHEALIETLDSLGVPAARCHGHAPALPRDAEPFLCFARRTEHDVVLGHAKIAGSAQRKRQGAVLQHGSVLLARSPAAPTLPGIVEATGKLIEPAELAESWTPILCARLGVTARRDTLGDAERQAAERISAEKYGNAAWTQRR